MTLKRLKRKSEKMIKSLCALLTAALLFSACGNGAQTGSGGLSTNSQQPNGESQGGATMGRWVETKLELPISTDMIQVHPMRMEDGRLVLLARAPGNSADLQAWAALPLEQYVSLDNGVTWQPQPLALDIPENENVYMVELSPGGALYYSTAAAAPTNAELRYRHWWKAPETPAVELTFGEEIDARLMLMQQVIFLDETTLYCAAVLRQEDAQAQMAPNMVPFLYDLNTRAISAAVTFPPNADEPGYEITVSVDGQPVAMKTSYASVMHGYYITADTEPMLCYFEYAPDGYKLCGIDTTGAVTTLAEKTPIAETIGGTAVDEQGNLYIAGKGGISRFAKNGTLEETVVEPGGFAFSLEAMTPVALCRTTNGDFLVYYLGGNSNETMTGALYRYHFDETLPATNETVLKIWSLHDDATVRAGIVAFTQEYPEVGVDYTVGIPKEEEQTASQTDVERALLAEVLAGGGPDVLVLDGLDAEAFAAQGMLKDLSEVMPKDALAPFVANGFCKPDGTYYVPMRFSVPVIFGDEGTVESLTSLAALQNAILACPPRPDHNVEDSLYYEALSDQERYGMAFLNTNHLLDFVMNTCASALIKDGAVDEAAVKEALGFVQAVGEHYGMANYTKPAMYNGIVGGSNETDSVEQWDGSYEYGSVMRAKYGWDLMKTPALLGSIQRVVPEPPAVVAMLQPGLAQGAYLPSSLMGVNAAAKKPELALTFVQMLLSETAQNTFNQDGMPVLQSALEASIARNSEYYRPRYAGDDKALFAALQTPVVQNAAVNQKLSAHSIALVKGEETLDEAVSGFAKDMELYLAERR